LTIGALGLAACFTPASDGDHQPRELDGCQIGGCSSQLCGEAGDELISTCEWTDAYACYQTAVCQRQANGACGWTQDTALTTCLEQGGPTPPANPCVRTGCSGQICASEDLASTCEWHDSYACYRTASCEPQADGQCGWTQDAELAACLAANP
jgi:eight-cysteine-cluster-containing protein